MIAIQSYDQCPDPLVAKQLEQFESQFHYPLGQHGWFRISHGSDYTRFFRAIGAARCFVAQHNGEIVGVISVARPTVRGPTGETIAAAYLSDLKIAASTGGRTLLQLLRKSVDWARQGPSTRGFSTSGSSTSGFSTPGFSIVMDGTARSPLSYTGRLGIPSYSELSKLMIVRIPCFEPSEPCTPAEATLHDVRERHRFLTAGRFTTIGGDCSRRSQMEPLGLINHDGNACGIVEDTRRCKLLYRDDGSEMISAHLSSFGFRTPEDAATLLRGAVRRCWQLDLPALFVCLPQRECDIILKLLARNDIVKAPATVFGHGFPQGTDWSVNTSEI